MQVCSRQAASASPLLALFKIRRFALLSLMLTLTATLLSPAATYAQAPPAPTGLTATAGAGQVTLSWNAASGASYYNLYRGTAPGGEGATPYQAPSPAAGSSTVQIGNDAFVVRGLQGQGNGCTITTGQIIRLAAFINGAAAQTAPRLRSLVTPT